MESKLLREEEDGEAEEEEDGAASWVAFVNATKCFAGASSFELPFALVEAGLLSGTIGIVVFAVLSYAVFCTMVECGHLVRGSDRPSFLQIGTAAFGPYLGRGAILFGMLAMTLGVCGTYLDFIGQTLSSLLTPSFPWLKQWLCTLLVLPFATALSLVRSQRAMAITSVLGIIAVLLGCGFVIYDATTRDDVTWVSPFGADAKATYGPLFKWKTYGGFMGNAGYLYLISTAVLPIEQSMKKRSQFRVAFGASIIVTTILNIGFAVLAAMAYTQTTGGVQSIVVLNLRPGALAACVKIFVAINQLFTYGLFLTPLAQALERMWFGPGGCCSGSVQPETTGEMEIGLIDRFDDAAADVDDAAPSLRTRFVDFLKIAGLRIVLCIGTFGVTQAVPDFGLLTGLTGGFGNNMLAFVFVPLLYVKLRHTAGYWAFDWSSTRSVANKIGQLVLMGLLFLFGISLLILAVFSTVQSMLDGGDAAGSTPSNATTIEGL